MRLTAVLVNYNSGAEIARALRSIADEVPDGAWEAIVIDNASADGSDRIAADFGAPVRVVSNAENRGFARGVNQGVAAARADRVLVMNPDCRLVAGALDALESALDGDPACALVGPKILNPDGTPQGSARGDPDMLTGLFGRTALLRRLFPSLRVARRNVLVPDAGQGTVHVVDWLSGACFLAQTEALRSVGGLDERYFLYWEDSDLCRRLRAAGYVVKYVTSAFAVHRVGVSSRTARERSVRAFHDSAYLYYVTHVAPDRFDPRRLLARWLLRARCALWVRRLRARGDVPVPWEET